MKGSGLPNHIAIIPDGNRRWAKERNLPTLEGHRRGLDAILKVGRYLRDKGVITLTAWGFSTENLNRSQGEINYLMELFMHMFDDLKEYKKHEVRFTHLGRKDRLPKKLIEKISFFENETANYNKYFFNLALDYGGRDEIMRAVNRCLDEEVKLVDQEKFAQYLDTSNQPYPYPDLVVRTGGEQRLSGYLLWQIEYAELVFLKEYLPDLTPKLMNQVLEDYVNRQRRFGR